MIGGFRSRSFDIRIPIRNVYYSALAMQNQVQLRDDRPLIDTDTSGFDDQ